MISGSNLEEIGGVGGSSDRKITPIKWQSISKVYGLTKFIKHLFSDY